MANYETINVRRDDVATYTIDSKQGLGPESRSTRLPGSGVGRAGVYAAIVVATIILAAGYKLRHDGIFACDATGYSAERYLAYCQASSYGDYDYGAFWYGLEPSTTAAAARANVLFLGNSRLQFGISTDATTRWFKSNSESFYLLGFAYDGNIGFAAPLLRRLRPHARVYVISVDQFFREPLTPPARAVMRDSSTRARYGEKRFWQLGHRSICTRSPGLCGHEPAFFRNRSNGTWVVSGGHWPSTPVVTYTDTVNQAQLESYLPAGRSFLSQLPVQKECVLLTVLPKAAGTPGTELGTAKALAADLAVPFLSPQIDGLRTFDGSHLDRPSAERWSAAFMDAAAPLIRKCLTQSPV